MLKSFDEVLSSQTKLCRVKQGTRKGERLTRLFQQTVCFSEMICHLLYNFIENAYLLRVCAVFC